MPANRRNELKDIIRRPPHWVIRFGTIMMTLLIAGLLILSTQLSLPNQLDISVEMGTVPATMAPLSHMQDSLQGQLKATPEQMIQIGRQGTVRLTGSFGSYSYKTLIHRTSEQVAFVHLPKNFSPEGQQTIPMDCNVTITLEVPVADITLYQKLAESLFSSFNF